MLLTSIGRGWTLVNATDINNHGQIAANSYKAGGTQHAFLLDPVMTTAPDSGSTVLLFGAGLVRLRAWRKRER